MCILRFTFIARLPGSPCEVLVALHNTFNTGAIQQNGVPPERSRVEVLSHNQQQHKSRLPNFPPQRTELLNIS